MISPKGAPEDEGQAGNHQQQHARGPVIAVSLHQRYGSKRRNCDCKRAVRSFFRGEEMSRDNRKGKQHWRQQTMDDAQRRCLNADLVHGKRERPAAIVRCGVLGESGFSHIPILFGVVISLNPGFFPTYSTTPRSRTGRSRWCITRSPESIDRISPLANGLMLAGAVPP
jgi:hypothetical protein